MRVALVIVGMMLYSGASISGGLNLLPRPESVRIGRGEYRLPSQVVLQVTKQDSVIARTTIQHIATEMLKERIRLQVKSGKGWWAVTGDVDLPDAPDDDEAYRLKVTTDGIGLAASAEAGFRHGLRTLLQLLAQDDSVHACEIDDRPALRSRGLMIEMASCKEKDEVYFRILEEMAAWKMNVLYLHFTDIGGCALELKSHPEVVGHSRGEPMHPMSQQTIRKLIKRATELGVDVIPEVESWGHADWLTHAHPDVGEGGGVHWLCLSNEKTYALLEDVIKEVASLFPSRYIHIGCDEARYAQDDACKAKAAAVGVERLIADHINRVNGIVRKCGKTSIIWGDVPIHGQKAALPLLDRDIIVEDWCYSIAVPPDSLRRLRTEGFRAIAAPALMAEPYRIAPSNYNLENVRRFCAHAKAEQAEGVATTVWVPSRYVAGCLGPGIAWAADQSWNPGGQDQKDAMGAYLLHRFGLKPTAERADRMMRLGYAGQRKAGLEKAFWADTASLVSHGTSEGFIEDSEYADSVEKMADGFRKDLRLVKANRRDFESLVLTAAVGEHLAIRRNTAGQTTDRIRAAKTALERGDSVRASRELLEAAKAIHEMESQRADLDVRLRRLWDRDRHSDDRWRVGKSDERGQNLLGWFGDTSRYGFAGELAGKLESLAEKPDAHAIGALIGPD